MQFLHTWEWVIGISPHTGEPKTRTSRIQKPNENLRFNENDVWNSVGYTDRCTKGGDPVTKWQVGGTYSVQPGRGIAQVGCIQICSITSQDVRYASCEDVLAEGFSSAYEFMLTWTKMHDKPAYKANHDTDFSDGDESGMVSHPQGWMSWLKGQRPAERYQAWVLNFRLVKT